MKNRRQFLKTSLGLGGGIISAGAVGSRGSVAGCLDSLLGDSADRAPANSVPADSADPWAKIAGIVARIKPPAFPSRDFEIPDYGAEGDNQTDCTEAFSKAIAACHTRGGGRVVVPPGQYITGAITLESNVNLHIAQGATIRFSRDSKKYPLVFTAGKAQS
jgi:polygalacturonase